MKKYVRITQKEVSYYIAFLVFVLAAFGLYWFLSHASITINTTPADAVVTIDNAPVHINQRGRAKKLLQPGIHQVKVEADGYIAAIEQVNVRRAGNVKLNVALSEIPTPVSIAAGGRFLAKDNDFNSVLYLDDSGKTLYRAKLLTGDNKTIEIKNKTPLTEPKLKGINEIIWSPNKDLALFRKNDGIYLFDFKKYDFVNQTERLWGQHIGSVAWAPDNSLIAYYYAPPNGERTLIFANLENTLQTRIVDFDAMKIENPLLSWSPDSEWLLVVPQNKTDFVGNKVYAVNAYSRKIVELTDTGNQLRASFSPDSNKILYATYSNDASSPIRSILSIMDKNGENKRSLDLRADLAMAVWRKNSESLVVSSFSALTKQSVVYSYDIKTREQKDFSLDMQRFGTVKRFLLSDDENMLICESDEGVFALRID